MKKVPKELDVINEKYRVLEARMTRFKKKAPLPLILIAVITSIILPFIPFSIGFRYRLLMDHGVSYEISVIICLIALLTVVFAYYFYTIGNFKRKLRHLSTVRKYLMEKEQ